MSSRPLYVTPSDKYHIVQPGDTLYRISQKSGVSVEDLKLINKLDSDKILVGQKIYYAPEDVSNKSYYVMQRKIPEDGIHTVNKGETLTIIARMYDLDLLELLHYNRIATWELTKGQIINLRSGMQEEEEEVAIVPQEPEKSKTPTQKKVKKKIKKTKPAPVIEIKDKNFISPLQDFRISQHFNKDERHQGIDLAAPAGTPIFAVKSGAVIYSGTQKGYGNLIILEHPDRVMTVYAHNEKNIAKAGEKITQGDQIATVGNTGRSTGNHLHFEIRNEGRAVDPQNYITEFRG